jgi:hypothetical protein
LSLLTDKKETLDLHFKKRSDLINFVIAISELVSRVNPHFYKLTCRRTISFYLIKLRLQQIAK